MKTPSSFLLAILGFVAYCAVAWLIDRSIEERMRALFRYLAVAAGLGLFFFALHEFVDDHAVAVDLTKALIALAAAGLVFFEAYRVGERRPVAERWKKAIGVALGVAAILAYFNGFRFGYAKYYHRWDQFHYYMGAKYFGELKYDGLYKCSAIAQHDLGIATFVTDEGKTLRLDLKKEVNHPDKKIRNLGGDNLLMPVCTARDATTNACTEGILADPGQCVNRFTPERWEEFKKDVTFFRFSSDKQYWEDMQRDHGYNPPPVWTLAGKFFGELAPASTRYLQFLAALDIAFLLGMFVALWWAFGWRVFAVAAIFWGCQSSAPFYWTGGAFLRQDWLFWLVLSVCLLRKKRPMLAGAAVAYATLLRIFPGLVLVGFLVAVPMWLIKYRRINPVHLRFALGGILGTAVLVGASLKVAGKDSYRDFYEHTIKVHDQTPLTNHMGLRVLVAQPSPVEIKSLGIGTGPKSGRMEYTKDTKLTDPFEVWKRMRNERYEAKKIWAYAIIGLSVGALAYVLRRVKSLWIVTCLAQIFIILGSQLTCYYYSFMVLTAPLTKVKRGIEAPLFGLAALSQFVWRGFYWNDDKYWVLTAISLVFCYGLLCAFSGKTIAWLEGRGAAAPSTQGS